MEDTGIFSIDMFIAEYEVDMYENLKTSSLLRRMQEVGSLHLEAMNYSYEFIANKGYVYLLVNLRVVLHRPIKSHETIRFETWVTKNAGIRTYRNFAIYDKENICVGEASTVWVLTNVSNHKIVKLSDSPITMKLNPDKKLSFPDANKVKIPKDLKPMGERKIRYTDIDVNAHVNNSIYGDIFYDAYGMYFSKYFVNDFSINYRREAFLSDTINLMGKSENEDNIACISMAGMINDVASFEIYAKLKEKE